MKRWCRGLGLSLVVGAMPAIGSAAAARLNWSTYLRAGPGVNYTAIDELRHGATVDLAACASGWCKVSDGNAIGYIDQDSLTLAGTPRGAVAGGQTCFPSALPSYKGPASNLFCAAAPTPTPAPGP